MSRADETNQLPQIRPTSTFAAFEAKTPEQERALRATRTVADELVRNAGTITKQAHPFEHARMLFLWGKPGRGKTHLLEALLNDVLTRAPGMKSRVWLARGNFYFANQIGTFAYGDCPVVVLDDLFSEHPNLGALHPATELAALMRFIPAMYEQRRLVIVSSNFPMKAGLLERVRSVDPQGRMASRLTEVLARSGEIEVTGPDYRQEIAQRDPSGFGAL